MKPTLKDYFSLSTGNIPLEKRFSPIRRKAISDILLGSPRSVTLLTGPRASGCSTVAAVSSILHALHGDGNVLCIAANDRRSRYGVRPTISSWVSAITPDPKSFELWSVNEPGFHFKRYDSCVYTCSQESFRRYVIFDPFVYFVRTKHVSLIWIEDMEAFEDVEDFARTIRSHPYVGQCDLIVNYQLESLNGPTHRALSMLRPIVTSIHHLPMAKIFLHPKTYRQLRKMESDRQKHFAKKITRTPL